jgi:hypothetical protein
MARRERGFPARPRRRAEWISVPVSSALYRAAPRSLPHRGASRRHRARRRARPHKRRPQPAATPGLRSRPGAPVRARAQADRPTTGAGRAHLNDVAGRDPLAVDEAAERAFGAAGPDGHAERRPGVAAITAEANAVGRHDGRPALASDAVWQPCQSSDVARGWWRTSQ